MICCIFRWSKCTVTYSTLRCPWLGNLGLDWNEKITELAILNIKQKILHHLDNRKAQTYTVWQSKPKQTKTLTQEYNTNKKADLKYIVVTILTALVNLFEVMKAESWSPSVTWYTTLDQTRHPVRVRTGNFLVWILNTRTLPVHGAVRTGRVREVYHAVNKFDFKLFGGFNC